MTLFLVLVIGMVGRAIMLLGPGALALSQNSAAHLQAQRAAQSGLQYATAKLRDKPSWRGDDDGVTVDLPGLFVVEQRGNVIGLVTERSGEVHQFRLRFNYQDGDPGADDFSNPDGSFLIDNQWVSVNNLENDLEVPVPRAQAGSWSVAQPDQGPYTLPSGTACLIVEGRSGRGINQHSPANPNAPVKGPVTVHVAEAYLQVSLNDQAGEASMMGGSDITFDLLPGGRVAVKAEGQGRDATPRLRSKGVVTIQSGGLPAPLEMENGEVSRDLIFDALVHKGPVKEVQESVGDGKDFFNLKWDEVKKAASDPNTSEAIQIPAGTYVNWDDGTIHYYDMDLAAYKAHAEANPADAGVVLSSDLREVRDAGNLANNPEGINAKGKFNSYTNRWRTDWEIEKDLYIKASPTGAEEFSIIPRAGASFAPGDDSETISLPQPDEYRVKDIKVNMKNSVISSVGNIKMYSEIKGENATLTSERNLKLITSETKLENKGGDKDDGKDEGEGEGEAGPDKGLKDLQLNLYVKEDILISSYDGSKYQNLRLEGLVYTWGDFVAKLADPSANGGGGELKLKGALVAYGADPLSESPGSEGKGRIQVTAKRAEIMWNDKEMAGVMQLGTPTVTLRRTLYNVY